MWKQITGYVTEEEQQLLKAIAQAKGLTLSATLQALIRDEAARAGLALVTLTDTSAGAAPGDARGSA